MDRARFSGAIARLALLVAVVALGLLAAGPVGWRLELWHFRIGFQTLMPWAAWTGMGAVGLALLALVLGLGALRRGALVAALLAGAGGAVAVGLPWSWGEMRGVYPPINDITTDSERPPAFKVAAASRKGPGINSVGYGGAKVAQLQRAAYPDIGPARTPLAPPAAFAKALATVKAMPGWRLTAEDAGEGRIEASERSRWFGFTDDIVIRVAADGTGSRIDVRSQSRWGRGDFGANARRVRAYLAAIKIALGA